MKLIAAVYDDWGIGRDGTQPISLSADRKFFRNVTKGAMVIVGRRTVEDFPGQKPLPGRCNVLLTHSKRDYPEFTVCTSPEAALELSRSQESTMVIGGGSIYRQMLPYCDGAYITKVHASPESDTFLHNLDEDPNWVQTEILQSGEENGITYEMVYYQRQK